MTDDHEQIIERMEQLIEETSPDTSEMQPLDSVDPIAQQHRDDVRRGAEQDDEE